MLQGLSPTLTVLAPASKAQADQRGHHVGIGVGGLLRRAVPADVRLDPDHVAAADEAFHAAQPLDGLLGQLHGDLFHVRLGRLGAGPAGDGHVGGSCRRGLPGRKDRCRPGPTCRPRRPNGPEIPFCCACASNDSLAWIEKGLSTYDSRFRAGAMQVFRNPRAASGAAPSSGGFSHTFPTHRGCADMAEKRSTSRCSTGTASAEFLATSVTGRASGTQ